MKTFILYIKRMGRLLLELIAKEIIEINTNKGKIQLSLNLKSLMHEYVLV